MKRYSYIRCSSCKQLQREEFGRKYAIYARRATEKPVDGMVDQIKELFNLAAKKDLNITDVFTEYESGLSGQRVKLGKLIAKVKRGEVQGILVTNWDRLSRDYVQAKQLKRLFKSKGVKVFTL